MAVTTAIASLFTALFGPDPTDVDDVPAQIQKLLDTNAAQNRRISTLTLELLYFQKRNAALHEREQATQKDISETLAIADKLVKPKIHCPRWLDDKIREAVAPWKARCASIAQDKDEKFDREAEAWREKFSALNSQVAALTKGIQLRIGEVQGAAEKSKGEMERLEKENTALMEGVAEWKVGFKKDTWKWKTRFAEKVREELEKQYAKALKEEVEGTVKENYEALISERDAAVEAKEERDGEVGKLKRDLANEQLLHRIAIDVTKRLQGELEDSEDNYELLQNEYLRLKEAVVRFEDAYSLLSDAHNRKQWEAIETQNVVEAMGNRLQAMEAGFATLKVQRDELRERERVWEKDLSLSKADRDAMLEKLVVLSEQRETALRGHLGALKVLYELKNRGAMQERKEIGILEKNEEAVPGAQEEFSHGQDDEELEQPVELGAADYHANGNEEYGGEELDVVMVVGSEDEEDDGYDVCGETEREADADYDKLSEGDASTSEEWQL